MKVSYKGVPHDLPPKLQEKLDAKFGKLSKLLEQRGEKEAHVVVTQERHLHNAEITLQFYDHQMVAIGSNGDLFAAMSEALVKLEKQAVKHRSRFREKGRRSAPAKTDLATPVRGNRSKKVKQSAAERSSNAAAERAESGPQIFRVNHHDRRKPITVEEALIHMEDGRDYMIYRDSEKECVSVLVRRKDGHFDLVEV
jgi:putative sigma-54 modulation protein